MEEVPVRHPAQRVVALMTASMLAVLGLAASPATARAATYEELQQRVEEASADYDEALQALQMLGFAKTAAEKALQAIVKEEPSLAVEELIRLALKRL
jgi:Holliday junction resolvasome RuvABC DNA-binding subunit